MDVSLKRIYDGQEVRFVTDIGVLTVIRAVVFDSIEALSKHPNWEDNWRFTKNGDGSVDITTGSKKTKRVKPGDFVVFTELYWHDSHSLRVIDSDSSDFIASDCVDTST